MLKEERFRKILSWLEKDQRVLLSELSRELEVSEDTVRRDIKELSAQKLLKEVRGGAVPHSPAPVSFKDRVKFGSKEKQRMAKKAIKLIKPNYTIILDGGTSTLAIADSLPVNLNITVITNSFPVVNLLEEKEGINVFFAGGKLFKESFITLGHDTLNFYKHIRADICFFGICSIDLELGVTGRIYEECAVKKEMIKASRELIALATPEKMNTAEAFHICDVTTLTGLITTAPDTELMIPYKEAGINII